MKRLNHVSDWAARTMPVNWVRVGGLLLIWMFALSVSPASALPVSLANCDPSVADNAGFLECITTPDTYDANGNLVSYTVAGCDKDGVLLCCTVSVGDGQDCTQVESKTTGKHSLIDNLRLLAVLGAQQNTNTTLGGIQNKLNSIQTQLGTIP